MSKAALGGKSLFGLLFHVTVDHIRKSRQEFKQGRNQRQELRQRPWSGTAYWFALLTFLS